MISGLFLQTLRNLSAGDPGFKQDHVLTASVGLATAGYSDDEVNAICHKILDRVAVLPTVTVASLTDWIPMSLLRKTEDAYPEGYAPRPHESLEVQRADVTPRYFETLGVPILEGRDFARYDDQKAPLVEVSPPDCPEVRLREVLHSMETVDCIEHQQTREVSTTNL